MAEARFGPDYCWLVQRQGDPAGGMNVSARDHVTVPVRAHLWQQIAPYWRVGARPMHLGVMDIEEDSGAVRVYGWSYAALDFRESDLHLSQRPAKEEVCRQIVHLRDQMGQEGLEAFLDAAGGGPVDE